LIEKPFTQSNLEYSTSKMLAVPNPIGGLLFLSENSITYHNGENFTVVQLKKPTQWCGNGKIDTNGSRWLLGDAEGKLFVLTLTLSNEMVKSISIEEMGKVNSFQILHSDQYLFFHKLFRQRTCFHWV
jgi:DNA damage-binding protein 1